jgi:hypothetical protein
MRSIQRMLGAAVVLASLAVGTIAGADAKVPETEADHLALAQSYREKATSYRKEAADQRAMAEEYKKSVPGPAKGGTENPWAKKMDDQYRAIATDADKMAADADKAADYHMQRARELRGR